MTQHIHLVGIGGTGMGPLAKIFLEMGYRVSGSDLQNSETTAYLQNLGAQVFFRHAPENVNGATQVIYSSAIPGENPEVVAARQRGIRVLHRSEVLAELLNSRRGIAVAGAHGKTTVTSMIALCLEWGGLDPTVLIGAHFAPFGPGAKYGRGEFVVAEADESDKSFLRYRPEVGIVTAIEADHLENYDGMFEELVDSYRQFLDNCKPVGLRILGIDNPVLRELADDYEAETYGLSPDAIWRGEITRIAQTSSNFVVYYRDEIVGEFALRVPGRHNVANALACIAAGHYAGLSVDALQKGLAGFVGANRRFQIVGERRGILIVDDYAHHPTEIAATLRAAREGWNRRIIAVFQPHRYSRTQLLMNDFVAAFDDADLVVLTDIYAPPPEKAIPGISSVMLADKIRERGRPVVSVVPKQQDVAAFLDGCVQPGDLVVVMGAGPIWRAAYELLERLADD
ncbi:MAG: UDP-N-acetylmuramate--L-alanine ligase [Firmicutes bacterium]|jgi:UDP-N-acetylmuramate--alanine ligase|nr:UDP-N-acetylmuramate--L-alanine ligase [Bacillota bacterium]